MHHLTKHCPAKWWYASHRPTRAYSNRAVQPILCCPGSRM